MSEKTHTVAIGAFVIGALLIAITVVIFALGSGFGQQSEKVVMVFEGSVKGLVIGAPVALRGVQIGQVTNLELMLDTDTTDLIMVVEAQINEKNIRRLGKNPEAITDELISRGLRAQLRTQSLLTGMLYVQLDFHPDKPPVFADLKTDAVQIPTIPTDLELLARKVEEIDPAQLADKLQAIIVGLNSFVSNPALQAMPANLQNTLASLRGLSDELRTQVAAAGPKLDKALDGATVALADTNRDLSGFFIAVDKNLAVLATAIASFEVTMNNVDNLVAPDSATTYQLDQALQDLSLASKAIQQLAETLNEQPESLLRGKRESDQ